MINRILIRIKVVQMLYNYLLTRPAQDQAGQDNPLDEPAGKTVAEACDELRESLDKSHELYNYLLLLMIDLTAQQDQVLYENKQKFMPDESDLNPDMRFVNNWLIARLRDDEDLMKFVSDHKFTWRDNEIFLRMLLSKVTQSDEYKTYMEMPATDIASDCEVWRQLMRKVILINDDLMEEIENRSIYWSSEDLEFMGQFAVKTIARAQHDKKPLRFPQFKDEEDAAFGHKLFTLTIEHYDEFMALIEEYITRDRWEIERTALFDRVTMLVAIAEFLFFPEIPTAVTLNEYIEIAKKFSTPQSGQFVNGVLNSVLTHLRETGKIVKP